MIEVFIILGLWIISLIISYYQTIYQEIVIQNICNKMRSDMSDASWNIKANYINGQEQKEIESNNFIAKSVVVRIAPTKIN